MEKKDPGITLTPNLKSAKDALVLCAKNEIKQALVRINNLRFQGARMKLITCQEDQLESHISHLVALFECRSDSGILLSPASVTNPSGLKGSPSPRNTTTQFISKETPTSSLTAEEEGGKEEEGVSNFIKVEPYASILYPGVGWEQNQEIPDFYSHGEVMKAQLSIELMRTVLGFVGKEMGCFEINLKPALIQRMHDYFYQVVNLVSPEFKHSSNWRIQYSEMISARHHARKRTRHGRKLPRWDSDAITPSSVDSSKSSDTMSDKE
jgi:hypothetical protein